MSFQIVPRFSLYIIFVFLIILTTVNAQNIAFTMGQVKTVRTALPTSSEEVLDGAKYIEYAIFLAIFLVIPILFGVIGYIAIMIFCCCRCCGFCGSNVPTSSEAYKRKHLIAPAIVLAVLYCCFILLGIIGVIFSAQGSTHVRVMIDETLTFTSSVTGSLKNVGNLPAIITTQLNGLPDAIDPLLNKALNATAPLDTISTLVGNTITQLGTFNSSTIENINKEVVNIRSGIDTLRASPKLSGVPASSEIPDIKSTVSPSITSGLQAITSAKSSIDSGKDTIKTKISSVKSLINDTISSQFGPSLSSALGSIQQPIASIQSSVDTYLNNQTVNDAKTYSKLAENIRVSLSIVLFCWCGIIYIFVFIGIIFRKTWCVHITTTLAFITAWIFILLAGIQVPAFMLINEVCTNGPKTVGSIGDQALSSMLTGTGGIKFQNVSVMLTTMSTCKDGQSLIDVVFGTDAFSALGINSMLVSVTDSFSTQASVFNISSVTESAKNSMTTSSIGSINVDYTSTLTDARAKLANGTSSLNNLSGFSGFNATDFDAALNALNAFTTAKISATYTYDNFETFDPSGLASNSDKVEGETLKNATRLQHNTQLAALAEIASYNQTLNIINANMDALIVDVASAKTLVSSFGTLTSNILSQIDLLTTNVQNFIATFPQETLNFVLNFAHALLKTIGAEVAGCTYMANYITATDGAVCKGISWELLITGITCFFIGILMHIGCVINVVIAKRIKYQAGTRVHPGLSLEMN
uniref:Prominin-1 n=1 Tax=Naegleria gruberi TaxID=5762 RepID=W5QL28_NAEGR|nr:prominin-1 [Naegleria gruberi]